MSKHILIPAFVINKQIQELKALDLKTSPFEEVKRRLVQLAYGYSCLTMHLKARNIFRARKTSKDKWFTHISELWYPPAEKVTQMGRLNHAGQSMLYYSDTMNAALYEMRPSIGEYYTILKCRLKKPNEWPHVMELGIAERTSMIDHPFKHRLLENTNFGRNHFGSGDAIKSNLLIRSFFASELMKVVEPENSHEYKLTVALAEFLLNSDQIDGVCYPSVAGNLGTNVAFKPQSADRFFVAESAQVLRVDEDLRPKGYTCTIITATKSISECGVIEW